MSAELCLVAKSHFQMDAVACADISVIVICIIMGMILIASLFFMFPLHDLRIVFVITADLIFNSGCDVFSVIIICVV